MIYEVIIAILIGIDQAIKYGVLNVLKEKGSIPRWRVSSNLCRK